MDGGGEGGEAGEDGRRVKAEIGKDGFTIACDFKDGKERVGEGGDRAEEYAKGRRERREGATGRFLCVRGG